MHPGYLSKHLWKSFCGDWWCGHGVEYREVDGTEGGERVVEQPLHVRQLARVHRDAQDGARAERAELRGCNLELGWVQVACCRHRASGSGQQRYEWR